MSDPKNVRIVHVDDRDSNRYIVSKMLRSAGYQVVEGKTGVEALQLAATVPDLMILDVRLPDMLGYEVCRRIKANPITRGVMIVQLSASFVSNESKVQALESGADQYLTQPVEPTVLIASVRALLRLKEAEVKSRTAASQWQSTFDSLSEGVALIDGKCRIVRCNKALADLLHQSVEKTRGHDYRNSLSGLTGMNKREFPNHSSRQAFELQHARRSFRISIDPVPSPDGTETESILVLTETTSQKRTEEALRVAEHLAATGRLAHSIAHEINNPLEAVTNLLYLLRREVATGTLAAEYVEKADRELARVGHITKQTLSFSRNSSAPESIALNVLIENVLDLYRADLTMKQIKIEKRYDRSAEIKVHAGQIRQVFSNLIANAIHAVSQKGRISIRVNRSRSWKRGKNGIRVIIADNGEGIARENTSKIFEAFFTTKKHNGSGLGLWLSLGIITAHGGEIRVRSTRHSDWHGSCFSVFLPFAHSSASESGFVTSDAVA